MKNGLKQMVILFCALIPSWALLAQEEVHSFDQDGVVPARQIAFDIRPFHSESALEQILVSLEGLDLAIYEEGRGVVFDDGQEAVYMDASLTGWYQLEIVKRYFSQDLEVSVDGYPVLLAAANSPLDVFLKQDSLRIWSGNSVGEGLVGSLLVHNLETTPVSHLDISGADGIEAAIAASTGSELESSASSVDASAVSGVTAGEVVAAAAAATDTSSRKKPKLEKRRSSRLFTPMF